MLWNAFILAGQRLATNAVATAAGVPTKALVPVNGRIMLRRVYDTLVATDNVMDIAIVGDIEALANHEELAELPSSYWVQSKPSLPQSVLAGINNFKNEYPILVTTADHALLQADWVNFFLEQAEASGADVAVALADLGSAAGTRTVYKFSDGSYSNCNLFALMTPEALHAINFWKKLDKIRKKPYRVVKTLGILPVIKFAMKRLSLPDAVTILSKKIHCRVTQVTLPDPLAATDIDSLSDWHLAQSLLKESD